MVSVIIPIYNQEKYLDKCLQSVLKQTYKDFEMVLVNDGSTDGSNMIIENFKRLYPAKIIVINKENGGLASARNAALEVATGEYVTFLDSDDYIAEDYLETLVNAAEKNESDVVCSGQYKVNENGEIIKKILFYPQNGKCLKIRLNISGKLYRTEYLSKWDIKFPVGKIYEDNSFNLQAFFLSDKCYFLAYAGYFQVVHEGSITSKPINVDRLPLDEWENCISKIQNNQHKEYDSDLFEFTVLSFFTYFLFVRCRKREYLSNKNIHNENMKIKEIVECFQNLTNCYFANPSHNVYTSLFKYFEISPLQKIGVKVFAIFCHIKKLSYLTNFFYTVAR